MTKDDVKVGDRIKFKSEEEIVAITGDCYRYTANLLANRVVTIETITNSGYGIFDGHLRGIPREIFDKLPN